jgi:hypothetical protein
MPKLWSTFSVDESMPYPLVSHFLTLARESPLSLDVCLWYRGENHAMINVWGLLLSRISKWRWVQLWMDENMTEMFLSKSDLLVEGESDIPCQSMAEESLLETAAIKGGFAVPKSSSKKLWSFLLDRRYFPRLRELEWALDLGDCNFLFPAYSNSDIPQFDWENLIHLTLTRPPSLVECLLLLQHCTNLETLDIVIPSGTPLTPQYMSIDIHDVMVAPPKSLRQLTIGVGNLVTRKRMYRLISSCLKSDDYVINVY